MHQGCHERPHYTGNAAHPAGPHAHGAGGHHHHDHHHHGGSPGGYCRSCCHPRSKCHCWCRECRKEAKELLVKPDIARDDAGKMATFRGIAVRAAFLKPIAEDFKVKGTTGSESFVERETLVLSASKMQVGFGTAFIGGGCCVHLSVEYAPSTPTSPSIVAVLVDDSESTVLAWGKTESAGTTYQIKEGIITTRPGADLTVVVVNATARVRWCEIFSC